MGGRYKTGRQFAGQFSTECIDFWLSDPRVKSLTALDRMVLFYLGLIAIKERREVLPKSWGWKCLGREVEASRTNLGRDMERCRRRLVDSGLIDETSDGCIIVCGARKRTPNLTWKDEPNIEGIRGYKSHKAVSSKHETGSGAIAPGSKSREEQKPTPTQLPDGRWVVVEPPNEKGRTNHQPDP